MTSIIQEIDNQMEDMWGKRRQMPTVVTFSPMGKDRFHAEIQSMIRAETDPAEFSSITIDLGTLQIRVDQDQAEDFILVSE